MRLIRQLHPRSLAQVSYVLWQHSIRAAIPARHASLNTKHEFRDREHGFSNESEIADVAVPTRHRGRVYCDQDFVVLWSGFVDLLELEKIRRSVLGVQNRFHKCSLWVCYRMFTRSSCRLLERADSSRGLPLQQGQGILVPAVGPSTLEMLCQAHFPCTARELDLASVTITRLLERFPRSRRCSG
jgi:hypothetical protein